MDPISQGVVGAIVTHAAVGHRLPRAAALVGMLAGMAPDLDIFFPTFGDVTADWYWHRGPTHAIAYIPLGALIVWAVMLIFPFARKHKGATYLAALVGTATHGLLDALTSYGTMLLWPFADTRVAWDIMPIIDPIFTVTLVLVTIVAVIRKRWTWSVGGSVFMVAYLGFALGQHTRAFDAARTLAESRGHDGDRLRVLPAPTALSLYRAIYEHDGQLHVDAVFTPYFFGESRVLEGTSAAIMRPGDLSLDAEQQRHFDRFRWFSQDTLVQPSYAEPRRLGDGRYSSEAAGFNPLWGLDFSGGTTRRFFGRGDIDAGELIDAILGKDDRFVYNATP
ncbi:MAG: metal-dependent hydrolase [Planctomycetota bacterium]